MPYLNPDKKIIIGESATRLREGEPLTHPQFISILEKLRRLFPQTTIQVTTNGSLLSEALIATFALLKPFELIISMNSPSEAVRRELIRDLTTLLFTLAWLPCLPWSVLLPLPFLTALH